jgi:hypothetical protein
MANQINLLSTQSILGAGAGALFPFAFFQSPSSLQILGGGLIGFGLSFLFSKPTGAKGFAQNLLSTRSNNNQGFFGSGEGLFSSREGNQGDSFLNPSNPFATLPGTITNQPDVTNAIIQSNPLLGGIQSGLNYVDPFSAFSNFRQNQPQSGNTVAQNETVSALLNVGGSILNPSKPIGLMSAEEAYKLIQAGKWKQLKKAKLSKWYNWGDTLISKTVNDSTVKKIALSTLKNCVRMATALDKLCDLIASKISVNSWIRTNSTTFHGVGMAIDTAEGGPSLLYGKLFKEGQKVRDLRGWGVDVKSNELHFKNGVQVKAVSGNQLHIDIGETSRGNLGYCEQFIFRDNGPGGPYPHLGNRKVIGCGGNPPAPAQNQLPFKQRVSSGDDGFQVASYDIPNETQSPTILERLTGLSSIAANFYDPPVGGYDNNKPGTV